MANDLDWQDRAEGLTRELRRRDRQTNDRIDVLWGRVGEGERRAQDEGPRKWGGDGFEIHLNQ
jgi:hypothetical protein